MELTLGARDLALLRDFLDAMRESGTECFLVGAGARVLGFDRRFDLAGGRTTLDWDFAVRVESWKHWEALRARLLREPRPRFRATEVTHRLIHAEGATLDLLPYGDLESPAGEIHWPGHSRMSALGLRDSEERCEQVDAGGGLVVPVAAVPSLALLKLHAYRERRERGERRDVQDFDWYLRNYESAGNELRIHEVLGDALREGALEIQGAGAALLGLDVAHTHTAEVVEPVRKVLVEARDPWSRVLGDLFRGEVAADEDEDRRRRVEASGRFRAFERGLDLGTTRTHRESE